MSPEVTSALSMTYSPYMEGTKLGASATEPVQEVAPVN